MKKRSVLILVLTLCLSLCACGGNDAITITESSETEALPTENTSQYQVTTDGGTVLNIDKPKDVAEVTRNDGTVETLTCLDLSQIYLDNEVKFEKNYNGALVRITAPVEEIHGKTIMDGYELSSYVELSGGWLVEVAEDHPLLAELSRGDMVVATGAIFRGGRTAVYDGVVMMGRCYIYSCNGVETTLELYTE